MDDCPRHFDCTDCPERVVCRCLNVTEAALAQALVTLRLRTLTDVRRHTGAGEGCTCCHAALREMLEKVPQPPSSASAFPICSVR
jgi:bacterioferritin-associated ferredoxin